MKNEFLYTKKVFIKLSVFIVKKLAILIVDTASVESLSQKQPSYSSDNSFHISTELVCYRCGRPRVLRSKCPKYQDQTSSSDSIQIISLDFY